ncbi:MAG: penicillin-binding protein activator [Candidatus Edwardsbacteria bacterium]|nr:penicillin-binding protein activator [Candidatus Edwardsbacteria bacterium]
MKRLSLLFLIAFAVSCATLQPAVDKKTPVKKDDVKTAQVNDQDAGAEAFIKKARNLYQEHNPKETLAATQEMLAKYPGSNYVPEAIYLSAKSRYDLNELDLALKNGWMLAEKYPQSKEYPLTKKLLGDCYFTSGDHLKAGQQYIEGLEAAKTGEEREALLLPLSAMIEERLTDGQLRILFRKYPESETAPALGLKLAQKELDARNNSEALKLLQEIVKKYPASQEAGLARQVLASIKDNKPVVPMGDAGHKVGLIVPLSGRYGEYGTAVKEGVSLAFTEYNKATTNKVKLLTEDTKGDIIDAIKATIRLSDTSQVIGIIGEVLSGPTSAAAGVANLKAVPFLSPTASEERISTLGPYIFQLSQSISWQGAALADCAVKKLGMKTLGVMYPNDPGWAAVAEAFVQQARTLGAKVAVSVTYEPGTTDFKAQAETLKAGMVQAVFIPAMPNDIIMIAPQLVYNQLKVQLLGSDGWGDPKVTSKGGTYVEGAIFATLSSGSSLALAAARFEESYKKAYGKAPTKLSAQAYDGAKVMLAALQKGASSREDLQKALALAENSSEGASGQYAFGRQGAMPKSKLMTIRNKTVKELE